MADNAIPVSNGQHHEHVDRYVAPATNTWQQFATEGSDPEDRVNVVNPDGKGGTVRRADLPAALKAGFELEHPEATHGRVLKNKYGDAPVTAGILGVARGATFGLSDVAARGLGLYKPDELRAIEEYNPNASTVSEIGGAVAGSFIPGLGIAGDLGHLVEEGAASTRAVEALNAGGKAAKVLGRYAPVLARGGAEGALYGAGGGVSKAAMSDDPITAESLVADIGTSALLGAGTGAVLSAGGKFLVDGAKSMRAAYKGVSTPTIADGIIAHGEQAATEEAAVKGLPQTAGPEGVEDPFLRTSHRPSSDASFDTTAAAEGAVSDVAKIERRAPREVPDEVVSDFKTRYNEMTSVSRRNVRQFERTHLGLDGKTEVTANELRRLAAERGVPSELTESIIDLERARFKTHSMLPLEGNKTGMRSYEGSDPMFGGTGEKGGSYAKGQGKIAMEWTAPNVDVVKAVQNPDFHQALVEHQAALDHAQALLGNDAYPPVIGDHAILGAGESTAAEPVVAPFNPQPKARKVLSADKLKGLFPDVDMAAPTAKEVEGADRAMKAFRGEPVPKPKGAKIVDEAPSVTEEEIAPTLDAHGRPVRPWQKDMHLHMAHHASTGVVHSLENAAFEMLGIGGGYSLGALAHHYVHEETGSNMLGYIAGAIAGVPLQLLMSRTIRAPLNRLLMGKGLIARDAAGKATGYLGKLAEGVDGFLNKGQAGSGAKRATQAVLGGVSFALAQSPDKKPEGKKVDAFKARSEEMGQVLANPMGARKQIHDGLAGVRAVDPMLADQVEDLAFRKLLFLGDKMPKNPGTGTMIGRETPWQPSDSDKAKWARYIETAENPASVMESLSDGSLTSEQVETLQTLYPAMYSRIRSDIVTRAAELQATLPWKKRLALGVLFDAPVDSVLSPESVSTLQATFVNQAPQASQNIPQSSSKPAEATSAQRLASQ